MRSAGHADPQEAERAGWVMEPMLVENFEDHTEDLTVNAVWRDWATNTGRLDGEHSVTPARIRVPTAEERRREEAAIQRARAISQTRSRAIRMRHRVAQRRARDLLLKCLTPEQRAQYQASGAFRVTVGGGEDSGHLFTTPRTYEISQGFSGNVYLMEGDTRVTSYCIHCSTSMPDEDHMLAQKLLLETNEREFLDIANPSPVY